MNLSNRLKLLCLFSFVSIAASLQGQTNDSLPNILLIIADDLGVDVFNGYHNGALMPTTPTLDSLAASGILFENAWSAPSCTPTRATIMSGKYGNKTGVLTAPGNLDLIHESLFTNVENQTNNAYEDAVVGKWHISLPQNPLHPGEHNVDHYMGVLGAGWNAYDDWEKTEAGVTTTSNEYATTTFTNEARDWINTRNNPWIMWLAHIAPHSPTHVPPDSMYTLTAVGTPFREYIAMIESLDFEINRLLESIPDSVEENTVIFFMGDNGTASNFLQDYPVDHGKGTLYQGGIRVPMLVSGKGVTRIGEREPALVHVNDMHATILELTGADLPGGIHNSFSFEHLLSGIPGPTRPYNYSEITSTDVDGCTIRNAQYKLIKYADGSSEFFDLLADSLEFNDLTGMLSPEQQLIWNELDAESDQIKSGWSCNDLIQNGDEEGIDCGGTFCNPCTASLDKKDNELNLSLYPNPSQGYCKVKSLEGNIERVRVLSLMGKELISRTSIAETSSITLNLEKLKNQVVLLEIYVRFGQIETIAYRRVLVQ